jgi:hypothetical protein
MFSRETNAQMAAVLVGFLLLITVQMVLNISTNSIMSVGVAALFYAIVFGGAHLYLALVEKDDADLPVTARWRTVLLVVGLATLALVGHGLVALTELSEQVIIGTASGIAVLCILVYWYLEARDGYREVRPSEQDSI